MPDDDTTYDGSDFALSNQSCAQGFFMQAINGAGQRECGPDRDTTYDGENFALSNQHCTGQFATGIGPSGHLECAAPPQAPLPTLLHGADTGNVALPPRGEKYETTYVPVVSVTVPAGLWQVNAAVVLYNNADFAAQDNQRWVTCRIGDRWEHYFETTVPGGRKRMTMPVQAVVNSPHGGPVTVECAARDGGTDASFVHKVSAHITALKVQHG